MSRPTPTEQRELNKRLRAAEAARLDPPEPPPMRLEGEPSSDVPAFVLPKQRLTITERDGTERVLDFLPDHGGAYLMIEWPSPAEGSPWIMESHAARVGIASIASLTLEDIDDERS